MSVYINKYCSDLLQTQQMDPAESVVRYYNHDVKKIDSEQHECCYIIPPHITDKIDQIRINNADPNIHNQGIEHKNIHEVLRKARQFADTIPFEFNSNETFLSAISPTSPKLYIYDANQTYKLPGKLVLSNVKVLPPTTDCDAYRVFAHTKKVHNFFLKAFNRNSIDGHGVPINAAVDYGRKYANAFWNGVFLVVGDGDEYFDHFSKYLDVIGHEMGHGVTGNRLDYQDEPGALNEHLSDVFGALSLQFKNKWTADAAEQGGGWLIANGLLRNPVNGQTYALRSMSAPGTAYDFEPLGKDPQPDTYPGRYTGPEDNGGAHINSGIPNRAFYLFAKAIGGFAWDKPGKIWYSTLFSGLVKPNANMPQFAEATITVAKRLYPTDIALHGKLLEAWKTVQVLS